MKDWEKVVFWILVVITCGLLYIEKLVIQKAIEDAK